MRDVIRVFRRILFVCAIVVGTGAMSCTKIADGIRFAPGYGYVILVAEEQASLPTEYTYYVFATEDEARKWAYNFQQTPSKFAATKAPGYKYFVEKNDQPDLFRKIETALKEPAIRPDDINRTIDRVVSPVPTAPAPR